MRIWSKIAAAFAPDPPIARGLAGARAYAIGDIHGRLDLLDDLLGRIQRDIAESPPRRNFVVFLGDFIDRGPNSAGVVERLRTYKPEGARTVFLAGNHEEVLLRVLDAEPGLVVDWLRFGGSECLASYGLSAAKLGGLDEREAASLLHRHIPAGHIDFLRGLSDTFRFGDYLFVHAGIRPGISLENQSKKDLRWIRGGFLDDTKAHGFLVVHGHTVVEAVEEKCNRIAIDTGAVYSGVLTSIVIEDEQRRYLSTAAKGV